MKLQNYQSASLNSFDFSFKTSSGDEINLKMYDNKTASYASTKTAGASASALTLCRTSTDIVSHIKATGWTLAIKRSWQPL